MRKIDWRMPCLVGLVVVSIYFGGLASSPRAAAPVMRGADENRDPTLPTKLFGTMGKEGQLVRGEEKVLFEREGSGTLTHMWFGGDWKGWGDTRIRVYVDGEKRPGIGMGLFLGHGIGWGNETAPWGTARLGKAGHPSGVYIAYKIPFGKGVKLTAQLAPEVLEPQIFWWIVRGLTDRLVQLGGITLTSSTRMKLHRIERTKYATLQEVSILDVKGRGLLYDVNFEAISTNFNYLEECLSAHPNGEKDPIWISSGTEDYFLGTYNFKAGLYHTPVAGLTHADPDKPGSSFRFSAYRFHEDDPIPFQDGLRLSWRNGEELDGHRFGDPKETTLTSYVWTYEW